MDLQIATATLVMVSEMTPVIANQAKEPIPWPIFLGALERFCAQQGWELEYDSVNDESCAIFYNNLKIPD